MMTSASSASDVSSDPSGESTSQPIASTYALPEPQTPALPAVPEAAGLAPQPNGEQFDAVEALVRLLVGLTLEGVDELTDRLREWDAAMRATPRTQARGGGTLDAPQPAPRSATLVGLVFEVQQRAREGLAALVHRSDAAARTVAARLAPALRLPPFDPMMDALFGMYREWSKQVDRLAARGQVEEQEARLMARKALPGMIDRVLDVATKNPEVRALLQQQGAEVAKSALDEARERVGTADALAERIAHTLLRRPKPAGSPPPQKAPRNGATGAQDSTPSKDSTGGMRARPAHGGQ